MPETARGPRVIRERNEKTLRKTIMKAIQHRRTFLGVGIAGILAFSLFTGCAKDARTKLGTVPEFHPEMGLGALQGYLDPKMLPDSLALIPPPPLAGSAALAHDEEVARSTFRLRDTPRFALAASDFDLKLPHLTSDFSCALNALITKEDTPYLYTLLSRAFSDLAMSTYAAKNHYLRKRPFQENNEPIGVPDARAFLEKDPSYPSGHTAVGWGFALILSEIAPDRAEEILDRGRSFGESRIVVNHHWYSDVVWGRFMARPPWRDCMPIPTSARIWRPPGPKSRRCAPKVSHRPSIVRRKRRRWHWDTKPTT
jgi:acid phosphatase (class A)